MTNLTPRGGGNAQVGEILVEGRVEHRQGRGGISSGPVLPHDADSSFTLTPINFLRRPTIILTLPSSPPPVSLMVGGGAARQGDRGWVTISALGCPSQAASRLRSKQGVRTIFRDVVVCSQGLLGDFLGHGEGFLQRFGVEGGGRVERASVGRD
jgi:hypothetical protein